MIVYQIIPSQLPMDRREGREYYSHFTDAENEAQRGVHKATLLERESLLTPSPTLFLPQAEMYLADGGSTEQKSTYPFWEGAGGQ